jgi:hypothetical protein
MHKKSGQRKGQDLERSWQHRNKPLSPSHLSPHQLQQKIGNRAVTNLLQAKLTVGQPNDRYEQEADRTAAAIMRMPTPTSHDLEDDEAELQTTSKLQAQGSTIEVPDGFETQLAQHQASGQPLPTSTRDFMEPRFGADFSHVRIHQTPALADAIHAKAFTHGNHIYFNAGQYNPGTHSGKVLLAHELTHVLQQGSGKINKNAYSDGPRKLQLQTQKSESIRKRIHELETILSTQNLPAQELASLNEEYNYLISLIQPDSPQVSNQSSTSTKEEDTSSNRLDYRANSSLPLSFDLGDFSESVPLSLIFFPGGYAIQSIKLTGNLKLEQKGDVNFTIGPSGEGIGIAAQDVVREFTRSSSLSIDLSKNIVTLSTTIGNELTSTGIVLEGAIPLTIQFKHSPKPLAFMNKSGWLLSGEMGFVYEVKLVLYKPESDHKVPIKYFSELVKVIPPTVLQGILGVALLIIFRGQLMNLINKGQPGLKPALPSLGITQTRVDA